MALKPNNSTVTARYVFERYTSPSRRGKVSLLDGMEIGDVRLVQRHPTAVYRIINYRIKKHPNECYSWDRNHSPVAVRRDADKNQDTKNTLL